MAVGTAGIAGRGRASGPLGAAHPHPVIHQREYRTHDTADDAANLVARRQMRHFTHDRPKHRRRWATLFRRKVEGGLTEPCT